MGGIAKYRANEDISNSLDVKKETFRNVVTYKIFELMDKKGVNKTTLAKMIGVTKSAMTNILSGDRNFTIDKITAISYALGFTPEINFRDSDCSDSFIRNYEMIRYSEEYIEIVEESKTSKNTHISLKKHFMWVKSDNSMTEGYV